MLNIRSLNLTIPVIQAALSGYSDPPMRRVSRMLGAEFTLCEVLLDKFVTQVSPRKAKYYYGVEDQDHPCGAQLMGAEPAQFVAAANKLIDAGFDLIDLNFACPVKKVLGRCRGGYLLTVPDTALKIIDAVRTSIPPHIPLTLKLRKGFDDTTESRDHFYQIVDGAIECGIDGITLHGRTVKQRYEGESDWNFLAEVKHYLTQEKKSTVPLIGSGDLFDAKTSVQLLKESKLDGLALARGIIGNPWLFNEIRAVLRGEPIPAPPNLKEQRRIIDAHFQQAIKFYGEKRGIPVMRGFGIKYANKHTTNPDNTNELRQAYARFKTIEDWNKIMEKFYG